MVLSLANEAESKSENQTSVQESTVAKPLKADLTEVLRSAFNSSAVDEKSSEEFTEKDLQQLKTEMEKDLPKEQVDRITGVFSKFVEGADPDKQFEGLVSCKFRNINHSQSFKLIFVFKICRLN